MNKTQVVQTLKNLLAVVDAATWPNADLKTMRQIVVIQQQAKELADNLLAPVREKKEEKGNDESN